MIKSLMQLFLLIIVSAVAGCAANGSAQGGGSDNGGYGRVKVGVPF